MGIVKCYAHHDQSDLVCGMSLPRNLGQYHTSQCHGGQLDAMSHTMIGVGTAQCSVHVDILTSLARTDCCLLIFTNGVACKTLHEVWSLYKLTKLQSLTARSRSNAWLPIAHYLFGTMLWTQIRILLDITLVHNQSERAVWRLLSIWLTQSCESLLNSRHKTSWWFLHWNFLRSFCLCLLSNRLSHDGVSLTHSSLHTSIQTSCLVGNLHLQVRRHQKNLCSLVGWLA